MDWILFKIADWHNNIMRKIGKINDENYSEKDAIFRGNLYNIIVTALFLIIGYLSGCFWEMTFMFSAFNIIREHSGGWHSYGNLDFCMVFSILIFSIGLVVATFTKSLFWIWFGLSVISIIYIFKKTPYINDFYETQPENIYEKKVDTLIICILFLLISLYINCVGEYSVAVSILIAIIYTACLMNDKVCNILKRIK